MNPRQLALVAVLAGATTAPACGFLGISPAGAQAPNCGGNSTVHPAPIDCENTKTVAGIKGTVRLVVDETGYVMVTAVVQDLTPNSPLPPLFLQVKAHVGISSNPGFVGATDVFDGNTASLELRLPLDPDFGCSSQVDIKIAPGQPTLDHIPATFRIAAPLVGVENCGVQPTVPTTAPTSSPTTSPTTGSPTTPASGGGSTTAPTASSVVGGTIPATGPIGDAAGLFVVGVFITAGAALVIVARRSPAS
jgi:hypothetical protein